MEAALLSPRTVKVVTFTNRLCMPLSQLKSGPFYLKWDKMIRNKYVRTVPISIWPIRNSSQCRAVLQFCVINDFRKHGRRDSVYNLAQCRKRLINILRLHSQIWNKMGTCFCKDRIEEREPYLAPRSRRATVCERNSKNILAEQVNKLVLDTLAMIGSIVDKLVICRLRN